MEVDLSRYGYIYRTTNLTNGKTYVGKHLVKSGEGWKSYLGSGTTLARSVRKYGRASFSKELLAYADDESELRTLEVELINREIELNPQGVYNILMVPDAKLLSRFGEFDVLNLYFEELLSMTEIADIVGVSQPAVHSYLQQFKNSDSRFERITQGRSLGRSKRLGVPLSKEQRAILSERTLAVERSECELCGDSFPVNGTLATHMKRCDGTPWPHCVDCDKRLSKRGSSRCREHSRFAPKTS